jgi:phosphoacetylglucosamine mutase
LHHAAERFDIGVYFEANGHGTVLFSQETQEKLASHEPSTPAQSTALNHLRNLVQVINQTVGDAISDMLLVEAILAHKSYSGEEWNSLYVDLPNRLVKVPAARHLFQTEDAERRLVSPSGLQAKLDELIRRYDGGRSFVRPSGTEDVVRVYAEATIRSQADGTRFIYVVTRTFIDIYCLFIRARIPGRWSCLRRNRRRLIDATEGIPVEGMEEMEPICVIKGQPSSINFTKLCNRTDVSVYADIC